MSEKNKSIHIQISEEEKNKLREAAKILSLNISSFVRSLGIKEANKILKEAVSQ